jgi:hypothetical protein
MVEWLIFFLLTLLQQMRLSFQSMPLLEFKAELFLTQKVKVLKKVILLFGQHLSHA